jgi:hypothetical protein
MAGAMTIYLENALLDHVLRNTPMASPTAVYVALFTVSPGESGGGTEVSGGGYARQQAVFSTPSNGQVSNSADIVFPVATADWGTIPYFAIFDAVSGGNMLLYGAFASSKIVQTGDQLIIRQGNLTITFD